MSADPARPDALAAADVAAFLLANPRFLADRPELYRRLAPPVRVHGDELADHMAAMLRAERAHAALLAERADSVLAAGRAVAGLAARVHEAVVALIAAADPREFVSTELPSLLVVDAATLSGEWEDGPRRLPAGRVAAILGGRAVLFRDGGDDPVPLHGEAAALARHEALVRVPCAAGPTLLALAARDRLALDPSQGTGSLAFLGRALAAALER
jgi:uncharacterized protein YigA (DUF484 family)